MSSLIDWLSARDIEERYSRAQVHVGVYNEIRSLRKAYFLTTILATLCTSTTIALVLYNIQG
jgi:hypothetical protein